MNTIFQIMTLAWSIQGGQMVNQNMSLDGIFTTFNPIYIDLRIEGQIPLSFTKGDENQVFFSYENLNTMIGNGSPSMTPLQETYTFSTGIRFIGVELGYEHQCSHPVESTGNTPSKLFSSYDKFYGKVLGKF